MAIILNAQECHCDGICGVGAGGEIGPYQLTAFGILEKLGCPRDGVDWWDFEESRDCVGRLVKWLHKVSGCQDPKWAYAAYNWGIGNVTRHVKERGCDWGGIPARVQRFANMERGLMCWNDRPGEWVPQVGRPGSPEMRIQRLRYRAIHNLRQGEESMKQVVLLILAGLSTSPGPSGIILETNVYTTGSNVVIEWRNAALGIIEIDCNGTWVASVMEREGVYSFTPGQGDHSIVINDGFEWHQWDVEVPYVLYIPIGIGSEMAYRIEKGG